MVGTHDNRAAREWLSDTVGSVLDALPGKRPVDVPGAAGLVLLLARRNGVAVERNEAEAAVVTACLTRGRGVRL